ncbi:MAG: WbqC family protein [Cyclobacteriaceae bacterium]
MNELLIEPHYLGSLEYYTLLTRFDKVTLEVNQHFTKQTYKNRCYLLTSQGTIGLSIPVSFANRTPTREVKIENSHAWIREHWGALYSAYGKSPFFEFFSDHFKSIWDRKYKYLIDLNMEFMTICLKLLQVDIDFAFTDKFEAQTKKGVLDAREVILPKVHYQSRRFYRPAGYNQNFGSDFVPNLSILDLLFLEGSGSMRVLNESVCADNEQF